MELDANNIFRFNIDKPDDFAWDFHRDGFLIVDKVSGKELTDKTLTSFYLRKPMYFDYIDVPKHGCMENWRREETNELFKDFYRECQNRGLVALVRCSNNRYGKLRQLLAAKKYFRVDTANCGSSSSHRNISASPSGTSSMACCPKSANAADGW